MSHALVSFSLGPVQDFIATARTMRDLWTGSYLLSWLSAHAMHAVQNAGGTLLLPAVDERNEMFAAVQRHLTKVQQEHNVSDDCPELLACLPNTFIAGIPAEANLQSVADACRRAVCREWLAIADEVHGELNQQWMKLSEPNRAWDWGWRPQIEHFWDVRLVVLPAEDVSEHLTGLIVDHAQLNAFQFRRELLGKLAAAHKSIRHYPPHEFFENGSTADGQPMLLGDSRPKCSLLGSLAQMGPMAVAGESPLTRSRQFWEEAAETNVYGTRLGSQTMQQWSKAQAPSSIPFPIPSQTRPSCSPTQTPSMRWP